MMEQNAIRAALDFSWNEASIALADRQNRLLFSNTIMLNGHDASMLPEELKRAAEQAGCSLDGIAEWSVGTGPGGFTGLRVASAFVCGLAYGRPGVRVRGVPSAAGLIRSAFAGEDKMPEKAVALFDGRRSEILAYGMERKNGSWFHDGFTAVLQKEEELENLLKKQKGAALEKDRRALEKFAPGVAGSIDNTPSIRAEELIFNDPENFTASPTDLIYLRAAVFVEARIPRTIPL